MVFITIVISFGDDWLSSSLPGKTGKHSLWHLFWQDYKIQKVLDNKKSWILFNITSYFDGYAY